MINIVNVSGGVDSTTRYLLAMERGEPFRAVFADTGNEHEITRENDFCGYGEKIAGKENSHD